MARESAHVGLAVGAARLERDDCVARAAHGEAGVAGRVAISIAAGSARAGLAQAPRRAEPRARPPARAAPRAPGLGNQGSIGLARGAQAGEIERREAEQSFAARRRIDD